MYKQRKIKLILDTWNRTNEQQTLEVCSSVRCFSSLPICLPTLRDNSENQQEQETKERTQQTEQGTNGPGGWTCLLSSRERKDGIDKNRFSWAECQSSEGSTYQKERYTCHDDLYCTHTLLFLQNDFHKDQKLS